MEYLTFKEFEELKEAVLIPTKKLIIQILDALKEFRKNVVKFDLNMLKDEYKMCKNINNFLKNLRIKRITFVYSMNEEPPESKRWQELRVNSAEQYMDGTTIFLGKGFWKNFFEFDDIKFNDFLELLFEFLEHEFVHELQNKAISKKVKDHDGLTTDVDTEKEYFADEHELMARAKDCATQLLKQFGKKEAIQVLKNPKKYDKQIDQDSTLSVYRDIFKTTEEPYKRFIKYTVEYIERT